MTRTETGMIMDILTAAYPRFYANTSPEEMKKIMLLWSEMFSGDDVKIVAAAVKALISCDMKGFPPVIGQVKERIRQITTPPGITPGEAWALVYKAACNSGYNAQKEFDALPEQIRRVVGSPNQLKEWALMDAETTNSVVASNFQRAFRERQESDKRYSELPEDVKKLVSGVARPQIEG